MEPMRMGEALEALDAALRGNSHDDELPIEREYRVRVLPYDHGWGIRISYEADGWALARLAGAFDAATAACIAFDNGTLADLLANFKGSFTGERAR